MQYASPLQSRPGVRERQARQKTASSPSMLPKKRIIKQQKSEQDAKEMVNRVPVGLPQSKNRYPNTDGSQAWKHFKGYETALNTPIYDEMKKNRPNLPTSKERRSFIEKRRKKEILEQIKHPKKDVHSFKVKHDQDTKSEDPWYASHGIGSSAVKSNDNIINRVSKKVGIDPDLLRQLFILKMGMDITRHHLPC
ncbi:MAG: hypothetical protein HQL53_14750 [Magnetococcales bacterium]|nr:hypothetical protein [Magnetococcales bacterium]